MGSKVCALEFVCVQTGFACLYILYTARRLQAIVLWAVAKARFPFNADTNTHTHTHVLRQTRRHVTLFVCTMLRRPTTAEVIVVAKLYVFNAIRNHMSVVHDITHMHFNGELSISSSAAAVGVFVSYGQNLSHTLRIYWLHLCVRTSERQAIVECA